MSTIAFTDMNKVEQSNVTILRSAKYQVNVLNSSKKPKICCVYASMSEHGLKMLNPTCYPQATVIEQADFADSNTP